MNYHGRVYNIQTDQVKKGLAEAAGCVVGRADWSLEEYAYKIGHRDARNAAADIASEADVKIRELEAEILSLEHRYNNLSEEINELS